MTAKLELQKHVKFLIRHLNVFPEPYSSLETNRLTLLYFCISGLDILSELDSLLTEERRQKFIDWIYQCQIVRNQDDGRLSGFRGSCSAAAADGTPSESYEECNLAQTYSALICLSILGDDFSRVARTEILRSITMSQRENGSFLSQGPGSENDMRFVYCAVAICHLLNDLSAINWERLMDFIKKSQNYDGGIGQGPGNESHGGSSYCAIAALALGNHLWDESVFSRQDIDRFIKWAMWKQEKGFHGRSHKPDDSCYAFWIGATLEILNSHVMIGQDAVRAFLMTAQHNFMGGFCKLPEEGAHPDLLHTYFSIAALSLLHEPGFRKINPAMNMTQRSYEWLSKCHHRL